MFPDGKDINVNMMPINLLNIKETLPDYLEGYIDLIYECIHWQNATLFEAKNGKKIAYITVHERWVKPGETQRRPGLHIERPLGDGKIFEEPGYDSDNSDFAYLYSWVLSVVPKHRLMMLLKL